MIALKVKNTIFVIPVLFCIFVMQGCSCSGNDKQPMNVFVATLDEAIQTTEITDGAYLQFDGRKYDFVTVKRKKMPSMTINFPFTNTGNAPLVILKVDVSCGCLTPAFSRQPVMPGGKGSVRITIDVRSQRGDFNKIVFIKSNAVNDVELLKITGYIK